ncbi:MAG: glycosyltransferase [Cryomorphaceae bacterium]|nr:glycosyltransferase [Cryomorphaceae bacterium]
MTIVFLAVFINYFSLILLLGWFWHRPTRVPTKNLIAEADVIVPCRNEADNITSLVRNLIPNSAFGYTVTVIDDHSSDNTFELANIAVQQGGRVVCSAGQGKKAALKTGALLATNPWLIFLDADVVLPENWITNALTLLGSTDADVVLFPITLNAKNRYSAIEELDFVSLMVVTAACANMNHPTLANGAAMAVKRELWMDMYADLRPELASGDDVFLVHAAKKKKSKVIWAHQQELIVGTSGTRNLKSLLHQRIRWGKKASSYSDGLTIYLSWSVLLFSLAFAITAVAAILSFNAAFFLSVLAVKILVDLAVLAPAAKWLLNKKRIIDVFWVSVVHPFFILTIALLGFVVRPTWKDRRI